ncbi:hypothetical protein TRVL_05832 [Trypanosoma vivax]|nr:hypothetical protein TRVL_05832 [Trypanosoma vivax]
MANERVATASACLSTTRHSHTSCAMRNTMRHGVPSSLGLRLALAFCSKWCVPLPLLGVSIVQRHERGESTAVTVSVVRGVVVRSTGGREEPASSVRENDRGREGVTRGSLLWQRD